MQHKCYSAFLSGFSERNLNHRKLILIEFQFCAFQFIEKQYIMREQNEEFLWKIQPERYATRVESHRFRAFDHQSVTALFPSSTSTAEVKLKFRKRNDTFRFSSKQLKIIDTHE